MIAWSSLRLSAGPLSTIYRNGLLVRNLQTSSVKLSGHDHLKIKPSSWQWNKFKDFVHYYVMVGSLPLITIIIGTNIFVGPATLTEIPEGYTPQHWEYHKHPITRFIAKAFHPSPQECYEKHLDKLYEQDEVRKIKDVTMKLDFLLSERNDQQVYYYQPVSSHHFRAREEEATHYRDTVAGYNE